MGITKSSRARHRFATVFTQAELKTKTMNANHVNEVGAVRLFASFEHASFHQPIRFRLAHTSYPASPGHYLMLLRQRHQRGENNRSRLSFGGGTRGEAAQ
jgi:hypothetical protein